MMPRPGAAPFGFKGADVDFSERLGLIMVLASAANFHDNHVILTLR